MRTPEPEFRAALQRLLDTAEREDWPLERRVAQVERLAAESNRMLGHREAGYLPLQAPPPHSA